MLNLEVNDGKIILHTHDLWGELRGGLRGAEREGFRRGRLSVRDSTASALALGLGAPAVTGVRA